VTKLCAIAALLVAALIAQTTPGDRRNGERLYMKNGCFQCHGYQGQGGLAGARLSQTKITLTAFTAFVRNPPSGGMPPYRAKVMTDQELADVYAYIQTFPTPPPLDSVPLLKE
jgi:ubiquinol-cytochrome c reductase cytochrome c subunit